MNCGYEEFKKKREKFKEGKIAPEEMNALLNDEDFVTDNERRQPRLQEVEPDRAVAQYSSSSCSSSDSEADDKDILSDIPSNSNVLNPYYSGKVTHPW